MQGGRNNLEAMSIYYIVIRSSAKGRGNEVGYGERTKESS